MKWWVSVALLLLLSGCGGDVVTRTEKDGRIHHSATESVYYSPRADSDKAMTPAEARRTFQELAHRKTYMLNRDDITGVRLRHAARIEISTQRGTVSLPLKDLHVDVIKLPDGIWPDVFVINLTDRAQIMRYDNLNAAVLKPIADALYVLKRAAMEDADETAFAQTARAYRAAPTKPALPEVARRLRVQVADAVNDKDFEAAADLCQESTRMVPWWPDGHFNCAVVLSETGDYDLAVREMKRYLLLEPDAPDAHAAQNNIYKWERKAGTPN